MPDHTLESPTSEEEFSREREKIQSQDMAKYLLAAIIESAEDAIVSKTLQGIIMSWNKGAERLFGYKAEEVIGKPINILIPEDHPDEEPGILARIRAGERIEHYETVRIRKDGSFVNISLTVSPVRDENGKIIGASKIARDITERKLAEIRLREALEQAESARQRAEEASRLKDEFLATVSHELRTPMTAIIGWIRMLLDGKLDEESSRKALETIDRNARSQAQLIEDLLDVSRIISGKMRLEFRTLDPSAVVNAAVDVVKPAAEAKRIGLQLIVDPNAGPISGDFERLQQVVWNLLSNAVKFTPLGGRITVELRRVEQSVEIKVSDTGIGIKHEFLPRVFERFSQADGSTTRLHGGLGMGLAIVKSIVEMHGGSVTAESTGSGRGATFTVLLPLRLERQRPRQSEPVKDDSSARKLECPPELDGLRVLVVDDEVDTCDMIRVALELCGSKVKVVNSAPSALLEIRQWKPDILVADISMPEMDGYELIKQVRQLPSELGGRTSAIALTALARVEDRVKALAAGYQMHVPKPVHLNELRAIIASLASVIISNGRE